ncbi:MAG TPA: hypothetical protein VEB68_08850 [Croceibacterium sp.]|nr:hypothetical protein [Croceibacterium sp.]
MSGPRLFRTGEARIPAALAASLLLAGCGASDTDPGPGGVTVGEARALDEAAEMLDAQQPPAAEVSPGGQSPTPAPAETPPAAAER